MAHAFYSYVSAKAGVDPVRTFYVLAPEREAASIESLEAFAVSSGWQKAAEEEGAVLVLPLAEHGWQEERTDLLMEIYQETKTSFLTRSGKSIKGSKGVLWCWETMIYLAGYEEGSVFAAKILTAYPNMFAAVALVNGFPASFEEGEAPSCHYLVPKVSPDYSKKNREIPIALWMFTHKAQEARKTQQYFEEVNLLAFPPDQGREVQVFEGSFTAEPKLTERIVRKLFSHHIRWKNGPDGTLAKVQSREEFYKDPSLFHHVAKENGLEYPFHVHLPKGMSREEAKGLPLVFNIHGRGEPAYLFHSKVGWDHLCDETKAFVLLTPDSPGNIWEMDRDAKAFPRMIQVMKEEYDIDPTRVYLTGFSNGGVITREVGILYPELFAAISPWNAPGLDSITLYQGLSPLPDRFGEAFQKALHGFTENGWELPCFYVYGDQDNKAYPDTNQTLQQMLDANGCSKEPLPAGETEQILSVAAFPEKDRFHITAYPGHDGKIRTAQLVMKNMPHGAINDEAALVFEFLRHFSRRPGEKTVDWIP